ncbi:hypothetical protein [Agromyces silvae]|uniref:hypothetical protein n=1 Tax=Agromyces silvae TaxID=3388266 RepID=UPI00280A7AE4|nr:hypothetical protein [Agromyces protaetiae]
MTRSTRTNTPPVLIGAGVAAQSIGFALMVLAALAALGLDRSGYPIVSWLGHPALILGGALIGVAGGLATGYGWYLAVAANDQSTDARGVAPAG